MVEENRNKIMHALKLIKDELKESINKSKIKEDTELNLKNIGLKFKPMDYYFDMDLKGAINVIKNIQDKKRMTFDYCLKNKFILFVIFILKV